MGLPHSEIRGSQLGYQLLSAYRRFQRPSSPLDTKASIMCPFRLGHANLTPYPCLAARVGRRRMPCWICMFQHSCAHHTTRARRRQCCSRVCSRCVLSDRTAGPRPCTRANSLVGACGRPIHARTRDHRLHLSKIRPLVKVGGSRMIVKPTVSSRGWLDEGGDFLYFLL